jgi:hypothetical protein
VTGSVVVGVGRLSTPPKLDEEDIDMDGKKDKDARDAEEDLGLRGL